MKTKDVVIMLVALLLVIGAYAALEPSNARGPVMVEESVGGGGGWGSPANAETVIPFWIWEWLGGYLAEKLIDSIHDCGVNTTCDSGNQPPTGVGGGGGGGFGGDGPVNLPNNARPAWSWLTFTQGEKE